jgi:hypothetical protein
LAEQGRLDDARTVIGGQLIVEKVAQGGTAELPLEQVRAVVYLGPEAGERIIEEPAHPGALPALPGEYESVAARGSRLGVADHEWMRGPGDDGAQRSDELTVILDCGQCSMATRDAGAKDHARDAVRCDPWAIDNV